MVAPIEILFPGLCGKDYQVTSPRDHVYNCVAWAAGDTTRWWWPGDPLRTYWPEGVPRAETLEAFCAAFVTLGYRTCESAEHEPRFEKLALFATAEGYPTHAARQLPDGRWTSKLGRMEDITHALHDLAGTVYGSVVQIMKRPLIEATLSA
jgi:hypothetical protein